MTETNTPFGGSVEVAGNVFFPSTEPILSIVTTGDEIACFDESGDTVVVGTVTDKDYYHTDEPIPHSVDVEQAYTVTVETGNGTATVVQDINPGNVTTEREDKTTQISRIDVTR